MKKNKTLEKSIVKMYEGNNIAFDMSEDDVMVNVTEFAKCFPDKNLSKIINSVEIKDYVQKLSEITIGISLDLLVVRKGNFSNGKKQGTWANRRVALRIAQKLSTEFAIWVDIELEKILFNGSTKHNPLFGLKPVSLADNIYYSIFEVAKNNGFEINYSQIGGYKSQHKNEFAVFNGNYYITANFVSYLIISMAHKKTFKALKNIEDINQLKIWGDTDNEKK